MTFAPLVEPVPEVKVVCPRTAWALLPSVVGVSYHKSTRLFWVSDTARTPVEEAATLCGVLRVVAVVPVVLEVKLACPTTLVAASPFDVGMLA